MVRELLSLLGSSLIIEPSKILISCVVLHLCTMLHYADRMNKTSDAKTRTVLIEHDWIALGCRGEVMTHDDNPKGQISPLVASLILRDDMIELGRKDQG